MSSALNQRNPIGVLGALCVALASCGDSAPEALPLSGVLITIDTTNAQALDMYGKDRGITPNLSALAKSSLVYDRAHTTAPITLPAHTSMMTGLYPLRHGVRDNGLMRLSPKADTLAERARDRGYQTAAFVSAAVLSASYGLDQGFEVYQDRPQGESRRRGGVAGSSSVEVTDAALGWLAKRNQDQPFFLWVHYFDPHYPYEPPAEFLERAKGNHYLGEVAAMDHDIGRLLRALEAQVGLDRLTLAVIADHGESHNRHNEQSHSAFCYQSTMQVPFLLRFADGRRAGARSDEMVSVVDIFPTFLEELQLGDYEALDGTSLSSALVPADRGLYMESYTGFLNFGWSPLAGWVDARGKYLHSSKPEFYDLASDPDELRNLIESDSIDTGPYLRALEELSSRPRLVSESGVQLDDEQLAELRALGYAAAGEMGEEGLPSPLDPTQLTAPVDGALTYRQYTNAVELIGRKDNARGIPMLREVLAVSPDNHAALAILGGALMEEGQFAEAAEQLERSLAANPGKYSTMVNLALAYESLGDLEESLKHYKAAAVVRPGRKRIENQIKRLQDLLSED